MIDQIISNIYLHCASTAVPCISIPTQQFLKKVLDKYKPSTYLEIWSADGFSLCFVANVVQQWGGSAMGFERWYQNYINISNYLSLCRYYWLKNISCKYGSFLDIYHSLSHCPYDLIFLDGQKSEYATYLQILVDNDMIGKSTVIIVDDVIKYKDKMRDLYTMVEWDDWSYEIHKIEDDDGVMVIYPIL